MRELRLLLGVLYPSLCAGITVFVFDCIVGAVHIISTSLLMTGIMSVVSIIYSSIVEFIINPKVNNNILALFLGACLWVVMSVICIPIVFFERVTPFVICTLMFYSFFVALIITVSLRYLFMKKDAYKKGLLIACLVTGLFVQVGIGFVSYGLIMLSMI